MNGPVLTEFSRRAMATEFAVILPGMIGKDADSAISALAEVENLERELSIYAPQSDISRLNRSAGLGPVKLSPPAIEVLVRAHTLSRWTEGAFDVTAGPLVEAWGFTRRRGQKPSAEAVSEAKSRVGYANLRVSAADRSAELLVTGMSVNLGAIGKGYALDRVAAKLKATGIDHFLIHGGRSSVLAAGTDIPVSNSDAACSDAANSDAMFLGGWKVAIEHPLIPGKRLGGVLLRNESLGTSGSGKQFFHHQGRRFGHVIDPRTGWPAGDMLSLTVITPSATDADALATALFVMGWDAAADFVKKHNESLTTSPLSRESKDESCSTGPIAIIAVLPTERQAEVVVRMEGLEQDRWLNE